MLCCSSPTLLCIWATCMYLYELHVYVNPKNFSFVFVWLYLSESSRAENKRWCLNCLLALYLWLVHAPVAWRNRWSNFNIITICLGKGSKNNKANYSKHALPIVTDVCTIFCTQDHLHIFMLQYFADPTFETKRNYCCQFGGTRTLYDLNVTELLSRVMTSPILVP